MRSDTLRPYCLGLLVLGAAAATAAFAHATPEGAATRGVTPRCERTIVAEVVAIEQAVVLNRFGAFNPAGMLYALRRDVVFNGHPRIADGTPVTAANLGEAPGRVKLRPGKRPRPLVLRANEGDCLEVTLHNLLSRDAPDELSGSPEQYQIRLDTPKGDGSPRYRGRVPAHMEDPPGARYNEPNGQPGSAPTGRNLVPTESVSNDRPWTRAASFHVNGLDVVPMSAAPRRECPRGWVCGTDGTSAGLNTPGSVRPGQSALYRLHAVREGTYFAYSTAAMVGGEGDGGQIGAGLFGAVNVQPRHSRWYRSQVTHDELRSAARPLPGSARHPYANLDYDGARHADGPQKGLPILAMLDQRGPRTWELVHTDLNAIVALRDPDGSEPEDRHDTTSPARPCTGYTWGTACGESYREFTVVMHDEVKAVQAFAELEDETDPLHAIKDGMGINYGVAGMGAMVVARQRNTGPAKDCLECRAEEFFLSSWAGGDPALVLDWSKDGRKPVGALYPDDPSNVHHSYLNDPVRFRNLHAGPKETHVFHLHAHQWVNDASAQGSNYLDSQTISPGATFSYEIEFGGSGNLNLSPGDSIFHCHLYPHFAQGMWELWRVHDVFEDGSPGRRVPDAEVRDGIDVPAIVPLPGSVLALMPTPQFMGYPHYIPGEPGHRPPQPPLDMDAAANGAFADGGLQRHVLTSERGADGALLNRTERALANQAVLEAALAKGGATARINAQRVHARNKHPSNLALAEEWAEIGGIRLLAPEGEASERAAMDFHAGALAGSGFAPATLPATQEGHPVWGREAKGYASERAVAVAGQPAVAAGQPAVFRVNGRAPAPGAPFADPCPAGAPRREYRASVIQTELTVNRHGWFDPQARILALEQDVADLIDPATRTRLPEPLFFRANSGDCIAFKHSNFAPNALALDDFQIFTPTDTIGQHIHLVKFDVTSSDGSGNGWNYEDGTFSPEEVRERVLAYNKAAPKMNRAPLALRTHPLFERDCAGDANCLALQARGRCPANAAQLSLHELAEKYPFCGAQRTVQRWYADPIFDRRTGKDNTLRTVFSHDHFGPSSHQQHGLYAALVVEPSNSVWLDPAANTLDWNALCSADAAVRRAERAKVIGGANLSDRFDTQCNARPGMVAIDELRPPLVLRDDGGPTSTRANVIAPKCLHGVDGGLPRGARKNSNPLDPQNADATLDCGGEALQTHDSKREYALAIADFAILYNAALEPVNPEQRDLSQLRFGHRQVPQNVPRPLAISSEDPGTQLFNYRNEPVPLRLFDFDKRNAGDAALGGIHYSLQTCAPGDARCTGDMANFFSTEAHASRDRAIATTPYGAQVAPQTRELLAGTPAAGLLDGALADVEHWRNRFHCGLYGASELPDRSRCGKPMANHEPWRLMGDPATPILAAYEGDPMQIRLIQGAQEAQHVFAMSGHKWLREPGNANSGYINAQPLGISEHFEFDMKISPIATRRADSLYLGSSIDQLWDGLWGLVRSYGREQPAGSDETRPVATAGLARLNALPGTPIALPPEPQIADRSVQVCAPGGRNDAYEERLFFDISVVRACQLTGDCSAGRKGIPYNRRMDMDDPNGIVFVRNNHLPGQPEPRQMNVMKSYQILDALREQVASGQRRIEPLVLRAAAGQCMQVQLRNHLPSQIAEGPASGAVSFNQHADNFLSMITDGFNYNQVRMSSSAGLHAPRVAAYGPLADGANIGLNALEAREIARMEAAEAAPAAGGRSPTPRGAGGGATPAAEKPQPAQGNLTQPCADGDPATGCTSAQAIWYAGDYALDREGRQLDRPIEFGAIPLSSFGDVIKHPAHGAVGALVIGPPGSTVCPAASAEERRADAGTYTSATICDTSGKRLYRDLVMVLQDAVDAKINGALVPNLKGAEEPDDYGIKAVNYRSEPLWARRGGDPSVPFEDRNTFDYASVLSSQRDAQGRCVASIAALPRPGMAPCDPETPVFVARAGSEVRLRVVHPGGHTRQQAISLSGHDWNPHPFRAGSTRIAATHGDATRDAWTLQGAYNSVGPQMAADLLLTAGGRWALAGDRLWRSDASFPFDGGIWGLLRVVP